MAFLQKAGDSGAAGPSLSLLRHKLGFVPGIFQGQSLLPEIIWPQISLLDESIWRDQKLSRLQKECILLVTAVARRSAYWVSAQFQALRVLGVPEHQLEAIVADHRQAGLSSATVALLDFSRDLSRDRGHDIGALVELPGGEPAAIEAVLTVAVSAFFCTLAAGLGVAPDFGSHDLPARPLSDLTDTPGRADSPYITWNSVTGIPARLTWIREVLGFIPNVFQTQIAWPDLLEAEGRLTQAIWLADGTLSRTQKAAISIVLAAANRTKQGVALFTAIARTAGIPEERARQFAVDYRAGWLSAADEALLDLAVHLAQRPDAFELADIDAVRAHGFSDAQILESVLTVSLACFFDTLQRGLRTAPDSDIPWFESAFEKIAHLPATDLRPTPGEVRPGPQRAEPDPDVELVEKVQAGDLDAFENLVDRHNRRIYRTLLSILGNSDQARDAMQDTFLKAFQHIDTFQKRSKFSTWLVSIATNTAIQRIRDRRNVESLDDSGFETEEFRPRQIQAWTDNPEKLYSRTEMRALVEKSVMGLPAKYRVVVMLRDIEQFPIEEAAAALGLGMSAVKARLLRGRLMLREALAPHFSAPRAASGTKGAPA